MAIFFFEWRVKFVDLDLFFAIVGEGYCFGWRLERICIKDGKNLTIREVIRHIERPAIFRNAGRFLIGQQTEP